MGLGCLEAYRGPYGDVLSGSSRPGILGSSGLVDAAVGPGSG